MAQPLNVEYDELVARAQELDEPMPTAPPENPRAPCAISYVVDAATQVALSADSMRLYLRACEREWRRLAQSLRNAAKAYEKVDEEAAQAITTDSSMATPGSGLMMMDCDPDEDWTPPPPPPPPPPIEVPYYEVRQAAADIEAPDRGTAFDGFANDWQTFQRTLQTTTYRFRPFTHWEGTSATLVEANFEAHRTWMYQMVQLCSTLAGQAKTVASAHRWAITQHPTAYEVSEADKWYLRYKSEPYKNDPNAPYLLAKIYEWYSAMQAKSEEVLAEYVRRASLPLTPVYPKNPPIAYHIEPPPPPPEPEPEPEPEPGPDPELPEDELPEDDSIDTPMAPSTPTVPSTGVPSMSGDELKDALAGLPGLSASEPSLKPASVGAGGGGGIPGIPAMPMQPPVGAESVAPAGPGARELANPGRGLPGMGGAMGGPMGGMPMAPGAGGQGNKEGKRGPEADQSLYEEDRPWTEAVIGNRRRKDAPEK